MNLRTVYLALAIVGAVAPYVFFIQHFGASGFGIGDFLGALFANPAAGGFTVDLVISSVAFWVFMFHRRNTQNGPKPTLFVLLNLTIGLSCALPAYLYAASRSGDIASAV